MEHLFAQCCKLNVCAFKEGGALNLMKRKKLLKMRNKYLTKSDNSNLSLRGNNGSEKKEKGRFFTNLVQIIQTCPSVSLATTLTPLNTRCFDPLKVEMILQQNFDT